jgi:hypothetical protein
MLDNKLAMIMGQQKGRTPNQISTETLHDESRWLQEGIEADEISGKV